MCEFCTKHGDGEKWYLQAENYAEDMLSDLQRRSIVKKLLADTQELEQSYQRLEKLEKAPAFVQRAVAGIVNRRMKAEHFGQVVPLEDVEEIFGFINSIVRIPCICREVTTGREVGFCYGVSMAPMGGEILRLSQGLDGSYDEGPDTSRFDELTAQQALEAFARHEKQGLCHSVWTFKTPFIGGICNCDAVDCLAMKGLSAGLKTMFRGEYVAGVDSDLCEGCRACMRACQFGALSYSAAADKVVVDLEQCFGCGVCRAVCPNDAIELVPRVDVEAVAELW